MGRDDKIAVLARGQRDGDRRRQPALRSATVEHLAHGADVDGVALKDFDEGVRYSASEVIIAQQDDAGRPYLQKVLANPAEDSNRLKVRLAGVFSQRRWPIDDEAVMWTTFKLRPAKDPWGHFYRCVEQTDSSAGQRKFGFYSIGSDGESSSRGNDADDLNTWDDSKYKLYIERENRSQRTGNVLVGLCFAPFIYLGLLAIWPLTKFLLADIGWWKAKEAT